MIPEEEAEAQREHCRAQQDRLNDWLSRPPIPNIEAAGDPLRMKVEGDGALRVGFQSIRRADTNKSLGVSLELDAMNELQVDIQGMAEANKPWNSRNKEMYQIQLDLVYNRATSIFASTPADH